MAGNFSTVEKFFIKEIKASNTWPVQEAEDLIKRLYELGLRPGLEIQIVGQVSFGSVTIIQYGQTRMALNQQEMACLHGP